MNSNIIKICIVGIFSFLIGSCASQKNTSSSSQEQPQRQGQSQGGPQGQGGQNGPGGQGGGQRQGGQAPSFSDLLSKMDSDNDGKLSESEIEGPIKNDFAKVDSDGDGYITKEEFANAPGPQGQR